METRGFWYNVNRVVRLSRRDIDCILHSAKHHYDRRVREGAVPCPGGTFHGWSMKLKFVEEQERRDNDEFTLEFSDLDLAGKALEMPPAGIDESPEDQEYRVALLGQIHQCLREINEEYRRINKEAFTENKDAEDES